MNGIRSSPAARIVCSRSCGSFVGEPWCATRSDARRLEHQALRRRHLAQSREFLARQRAEVRVRQHPALERPLAAPCDVGDEVVEAELGEPRPNAGVMSRLVAGQHQQLLDAAPRRAVEQRVDLVGRVQVRPVRLERAVLAMRDARPRQRQRDVAREGDATTHPASQATGHRDPQTQPAMVRTAALLAVLVAGSAALTGCGTASVDRPNVSATLVLDGAPSAVDVGIYVAAARGYDDAEGVPLKIRAGTTSETGLLRLRSGSATFAVLDIHDLALARERRAARTSSR